MMRIPRRWHICPNCVTGTTPCNCSFGLASRTYTFFQSVYSATGMPYFLTQARNTPAAAQIVSSPPSAPAYLRWRRPPCSSNTLAVLVPPTRGGNFHPSAPVPPHVLSARAACAPGSTALRTTSSAAGSAHSLPHDRRSPSAQPPTSARIALLPPPNTSCPPAATLVLEISSTSCGSTPAPRYRVSALVFLPLDSACSADSSSPSALRHLPVSVPPFSLVPMPRLA